MDVYANSSTDLRVSELNNWFTTKGNHGKKLLLMNRDSLEFCPSRHNEIIIDPVSFSTMNPITNNPTQFRIQPSTCGKIEMAWLRLVCSETGSTNTVTPICAPLMIDNIRIYYGSVGKPLQILYGDNLYNQFEWSSYDEINNFAAFNSLNFAVSSYGGETAIVASGTQTYLVPLLYSILNEMDPKINDRDIIVEVRLQPNPVSAGTGILALTQMRLRLMTLDYPAQEQKLMQLAKTHCIVRPYVDNVYIESTYTITAGVPLDIPIQLEGYYASFLVLIRSSKNISGASIRTCTAIGGAGNLEAEGSAALDVLDKSKQSVFGSGSSLPIVFRTFLPVKHGAGQMSTLIPAYWMLWSEGRGNFANVLKYGLKEGMLYVNNDHFLRIIPAQVLRVEVILSHYGVSVIKYCISRIQTSFKLCK